MNFAEGKSICHVRLTFVFRIGSNMCCVQEGNLFEYANSTPFAIGGQYARTKFRLMQALTYDSFCVSSLVFG